ncbi:hypothetical protein BJ165DRAFT_175407 [Panaeolus papilionaceus]|nr:hypothetical protein BJ165DRAFT_175407 [Panaeolus papilionaceus]
MAVIIYRKSQTAEKHRDLFQSAAGDITRCIATYYLNWQRSTARFDASVEPLVSEAMTSNLQDILKYMKEYQQASAPKSRLPSGSNADRIRELHKKFMLRHAEQPGDLRKAIVLEDWPESVYDAVVNEAQKMHLEGPPASMIPPAGPTSNLMQISPNSEIEHAHTSDASDAPTPDLAHANNTELQNDDSIERLAQDMDSGQREGAGVGENASRSTPHIAPSFSDIPQPLRSPPPMGYHLGLPWIAANSHHGSSVSINNSNNVSNSSFNYTTYLPARERSRSTGRSKKAPSSRDVA